MRLENNNNVTDKSEALIFYRMVSNVLHNFI